MSTTTPTASAEDVISESWSSWTDKPLTESKLHNKLSSRSRKSVEDILEAAKRRQDRAEQNLASQRSARKQQLESERAREVEVRKRHDDGIEAIAAESARKLAHAEEVRLAKQKQQAERLKAHEEHAEAVRQRKMAQPPVAEGEAGHDDAQRDTERGAPSASHPARGGEDGNLVIDLPWTMFGEKSDAAGAASSSVDSAAPKDNPLHAKLSSRSRKSVEEVMQLSQRRMEAAAAAKEARDAERLEVIKKERDRAEAVKTRNRQAIDEVQQNSSRKMQIAEEHRAQKLKEQQERLQREKERAEEVRRRRLESPEKAPRAT